MGDEEITELQAAIGQKRPDGGHRQRGRQAAGLALAGSIIPHGWMQPGFPGHGAIFPLSMAKSSMAANKKVGAAVHYYPWRRLFCHCLRECYIT